MSTNAGYGNHIICEQEKYGGEAPTYTRHPNPHRNYLMKEGLHPACVPKEKAVDSGITPFYNFLDPNNAHKVEKPLIDVSYITSSLNEQHITQGNTYGKGLWFHWDYAHFSSMGKDSVDYLHTMHNNDFFAPGMIMANMLYLDTYIGRAGIASTNLTNPRTIWAHSAAFSMGLIRANVATFIGLGGMLYSYEYLYRYGVPAVPNFFNEYIMSKPNPAAAAADFPIANLLNPDTADFSRDNKDLATRPEFSIFRIRDPSVNGWKQSWEPGQNTFAARMASCVFPALGGLIWHGNHRRFIFHFGILSTFAGMYELNRVSGNQASSRLYIYNQMQRKADLAARTGSLMPSTSEKQVDRDTGLMPDVHQSKFMNYNHSASIDFTFENGAGGDNFPMVPGRIQVPNPYFNFRKAVSNISSWTGNADTDRNAGERQFRYKNDTWLLPSVVTAATSVGSADRAPKLYVAGL